MRQKLLLFIFIITVISCGTGKYYVNIPYKYNHDNWFKPKLFDCVDCKNKYTDFIKEYFENDRVVFQPYSEKVIKNRKYISETHNTLIKFGYKKIIPVEFYSTNIKGFIDSLFYWKENNSDTANYYYKFWQRRKSQDTYHLTFQIISDLNEIYTLNNSLTPSTQLNDTLLRALEYDYKMVNGEVERPKEFYPVLFDFLNSTGQYVPAYKILYKPIDFTELGLDKSKFVIKLPLDTVKQSDYTTFRLGYFDNNNNWIDSWIKSTEYDGP